MQDSREKMCTVIAKESARRVAILTGLPCCLAVEEVAAAIPKVSRENGWFELFDGEIETQTPGWASWLEGESKMKALKGLPTTCRGKKVWFFDVGERYAALPAGKPHGRRLRLLTR